MRGYTSHDLEHQREIIDRAFFNRECSRDDYNKHMDEIKREIMVKINNVYCLKYYKII